MTKIINNNAFTFRLGVHKFEAITSREHMVRGEWKIDWNIYFIDNGAVTHVTCADFVKRDQPEFETIAEVMKEAARWLSDEEMVLNAA